VCEGREKKDPTWNSLQNVFLFRYAYRSHRSYLKLYPLTDTHTECPKSVEEKKLRKKLKE